MPSDPRNNPSQPHDVTVPARASVKPADRGESLLHKGVPWVLQQFFQGGIDLDQELSVRYPQMPIMSLINFRAQGAAGKIGVATLSTQDGAAGLRVELDTATKAISFTFALNSMLAFRFNLTGLTDRDRQHWLDLMRREADEVAFLWSQARYRADYIIAAPHKHFTNLYAFSPANVESAARLTSEVTRKLLGWLEGFWLEDQKPPMQSW
jgi:hypothetical protein